MNARLDDPTTTSDPILPGILIMTMAITIVGMLALIPAAAGDVHHVTVRVDNQAALALQIDALDAAGDRSGWATPTPGS
jgi:hypothetical protein